MLPVNEVFETIQGEGHFAGRPSTFIRLQGCDVGCPWCDTRHTWERALSDRVSIAEMRAKVDPSAKHALVKIPALATSVAALRASHVVITGGEPLDHQGLTELVVHLAVLRLSVQIETSGTVAIPAGLPAWVTVSPKVNMPGGRKLVPSALARADEIKFPVGKLADVRVLQALLDEHRPRTGLIWLQPLSMSEKATALCVEQATENNWRISVQTHRYLGLR